MSSLNRRKDDTLNDLHSAESRHNSSEIRDLETEIETNKIKEREYYTNMKGEIQKTNKEQDTKRDELKKVFFQNDDRKSPQTGATEKWQDIRDVHTQYETTSTLNPNYEKYLKGKVANDVLAAKWEIYEFIDKDEFPNFLKWAESFQSKFWIDPSWLEEFTNNGFNYGAKNTPVTLTIQKVWDKYEFTVINLWKTKNITEVEASMDVAKNKAEIANSITQQEARLLQLITNNVAADWDQSVMDILGNKWMSETKTAMVSKMAQDILEKNSSLYKKFAQEKGTDDRKELADIFAKDVQEYPCKRTSEVKDGAGNGILFVKEKIGWNITYETAVLPDGDIVCKAKITVDAKSIEDKAEKFNQKMK